MTKYGAIELKEVLKALPFLGDQLIASIPSAFLENMNGAPWLFAEDVFPVPI